MSEEKRSWLSRLRGGLSKSTQRVTESITGIFTKKKLDQATLGELEDALIQADLGVSVAARLVEKLGRERFGKEVTDEEVRGAFAEDIAEILQPVAVPLLIDPARKPYVVLVVGVNGSGKTTTIGKLAFRLREEGRSSLIAAADTYRAAAIDQMRVWADRAGTDIVAHQPGADPGAVVYDAIQAAQARRIDVVLIDTAGRLHTKVNLMAELGKIRRVVERLIPEAPQEVLLVVDATTGMNAMRQAMAFHETTTLTGLVITKLDGSARGGTLLAVEEQLRVPVKLVGLGEGLDDLNVFDPGAYLDALFGSTP
jgi:fused signal recognition particle receptor